LIIYTEAGFMFLGSLVKSKGIASDPRAAKSDFEGEKVMGPSA
jgi:hypothetical protein